MVELMVELGARNIVVEYLFTLVYWFNEELTGQ